MKTTNGEKNEVSAPNQPNIPVEVDTEEVLYTFNTLHEQITELKEVIEQLIVEAAKNKQYDELRTYVDEVENFENLLEKLLCLQEDVLRPFQSFESYCQK